MGYSPQDNQERLVNLDRIRWGPRFVPRPPIHIPGLPDLEKAKRPKKEQKPPHDPGYEKYQLRLW